jgi:biopolymer transport protein ExbD
MAGVDVGGQGRKKRAVDADINLIPFIDLLLVTVAFLLITAVWTTNSRLNANAELPGEVGPNPPAPERTLHIRVNDDSFTLSWMRGSVVESETPVKRGSDQNYPELRDAIATEYRAHANHHDPSDHDLDRAVLHTPNDMAYGDLVHVMDAVASTRREVHNGDAIASIPAFTQSFAVR